MGTNKPRRDEDWNVPELAAWKHAADADGDDEPDEELPVGGPLLGDVLGPATREIDWERFDALDRLFTAMGNDAPNPKTPAVRDAALKAVLAELTAAAEAVGKPPEDSPVPGIKPTRLRIEELWSQR